MQRREIEKTKQPDILDIQFIYPKVDNDTSSHWKLQSGPWPHLRSATMPFYPLWDKSTSNRIWLPTPREPHKLDPKVWRPRKKSYPVWDNWPQHCPMRYTLPMHWATSLYFWSCFTLWQCSSHPNSRPPLCASERNHEQRSSSPNECKPSCSDRFENRGKLFHNLIENYWNFALKTRLLESRKMGRFLNAFSIRTFKQVHFWVWKMSLPEACFWAVGRRKLRFGVWEKGSWDLGTEVLNLKKKWYQRRPKILKYWCNELRFWAPGIIAIPTN